MKTTVLITNKNGKIIKLLCDELVIVEDKTNLLELIKVKYLFEYFQLMYNLDLGNRIRNFKIALTINDNEQLLFINAYKMTQEDFVLILTSDILEDEEVFDSIIQSYNLEVKSNIGGNIANDFEQLSRLNNKLINIQREYGKTNSELKNLNIQLESIIESIQEYLVLADLEGKIIISNSNYNDFFKNEKNILSFIEENNKYLYKNILEQEFNEEYLYMNDIKLKSHMDRYFDAKVVPIFDSEGNKKYFVITFDDVTKRMENIRRLRNLKMAFDQSDENVAITNTEYEIIFANQSFIAEYSFSDKKEVLNKDIRDLIEKIEKPDKNELINRKIYYNQRLNGEFFPVEISKSEVELGKEVISYIYFVKNITEQLEYEEKLTLLAKKDQMTGTYSREAGIAYLRDFLAGEDQSTKEISILFLDINALKQVNDSFGHQSGDDLISHIVDAINESTRSNDIVARLGGDEFLIILPDTDFNNAKMIKNRIKESAHKRNKKQDFLVSVSIGIASSTEIDSKKTDKLISLADNRMYKEKKEYYQKKEKEPR